MTDKNILIVLNEDHGQWALGSYGNREINTPTMDYLARTGVQMDNAFTPTPVCSPARACLLTGRLSSQHGVHDYLASGSEVDSQDWLGDEILLPKLLADAGYQTTLIGKWHLGNDNHPQAGFEYWFTHSADYPIEHGGPHRYSDQRQVVTLTGYKTQILTDRAISYLRRRDMDRPFFLLVSYTASHSPWNNHPERLVDQYRQCRFEDIPEDVLHPFGTSGVTQMAVGFKALHAESAAVAYTQTCLASTRSAPGTRDQVQLNERYTDALACDKRFQPGSLEGKECIAKAFRYR